MNVTDTLDQLLALQNVDSGIQALEKSLAFFPKQLAQAQEEQAAVEEQVAQARAKVDAVQKRRHDMETEIDACSAKVKKFENQKLDVKTNEEYHALNHQIEHEKAKQSDLEDQVLLSFDEEQAAQQQLDNLNAKLDEAKKRTEARKAELEAHADSDKKRLEELKESRERIAPGLDKSILAKYERMRQNKGGAVVVGVPNGVCGGCFTTLPPQLVNEVRKRQTLLYCEACGRFLARDPAED